MQLGKGLTVDEKVKIEILRIVGKCNGFSCVPITSICIIYFVKKRWLCDIKILSGHSKKAN